MKRCLSLSSATVLTTGEVKVFSLDGGGDRNVGGKSSGDVSGRFSPLAEINEVLFDRGLSKLAARLLKLSASARLRGIAAVRCWGQGGYRALV